MSRISRNIGVTVPPAMAEEFEQLARDEQSSKSELFRRIFRFYKASRKSKQADGFDAWVEQAIFEAAEEKKTTPLTSKEIRSLDERLLRYGAERAEAAGIDMEDEEEQEEEIHHLIYAERQSQRVKAPGRP